MGEAREVFTLVSAEVVEGATLVFGLGADEINITTMQLGVRGKPRRT